MVRTRIALSLAILCLLTIAVASVGMAAKPSVANIEPGETQPVEYACLADAVE